MTTEDPFSGGDVGTTIYHSDATHTAIDCADQMRSEVTSDPDKRLLIFTVSESPEQLDEAWDEEVGDDVNPAHVAIVVASAARQASEKLVSADGTPINVKYTSPQDLTGITIAISRVLEAWAGHSLAVCLRDVDMLSQYHDSEVVFRFVNSLVQTLRDEGAHVHAHIRPSMLSEQEASAISALFDHVEEV